MTLTIELPNNLSEHDDPAREALQAFVLQAVRADVLERPHAAKLMGMGRIEFGEFLHANGIPATTYGLEDFLHDVESGDRLRASGHLPG
jgi:hypothetical protein